MNEDTNAIIRTFLVAQTILTDVVALRVYCPRLPENAVLPALGFFTRGGRPNPHIPPIAEPSVQFDCWGESPIVARQVYRALYDVLQGIQNESVATPLGTYNILSAIEEVEGQDLQDVDIPKYYRVLTYFAFMIRAE